MTGQKEETQSFFGRGIYLALLLLLFAGGSGIRLYRINEEPRDFWTLRQYHNALTARSLYFVDNPDIPEWRQAAVVDQEKWLAEPPILEVISAQVYRLLGREQFWVFRSMTVGAWMLGALFLLLLARKMLSDDGALVAVAYYLFLPYGITASRSWQPDPLMIMGVIASVYFIYRYFEAPSLGRLVVCGAISALATFFKPGGSLLTLLGVFGFLSIYTRGWAKTFRPGAAWGYALLTVSLSVVAIAVSAWAGVYQPGSHLSTYMSPHLLLTLFFWKGWFGILYHMLTPVGLLLAAVGLAIFPRGKPFVAVLGYGAGYFVFSLLCTFTTPNHDYWHLQTIPLTALLLGSASQPAWRALVRLPFRIPARIAVILLGFTLIAVGTERAPWIEEDSSRYESYMRTAAEIGEAVGHSTRVIMLDYDFGNSLRYFAEINGPVWPLTQAMEYDKQTGKDRDENGEPVWNSIDLTARERFERFYADRDPEFFVIYRLIPELDKQPGLREFLSRFPLLRRGHRYIVYDLRNSESDW